MKYTPVVLFILLVLQAGCANKVIVAENNETGLLSWRYTDAQFSLQLIQLHPDYVSAFYAARGLQKELVETMRRQCVFGSIVRNLSDSELHYEVAEWRYSLEAGKMLPVPTKTDWVKQWAGMGSAFQWSILPDKQIFAPSDWSQGFTTLPLSQGTEFDFSFSWHLDEKQFHGLIKGVRCASLD